MNRLSTLILGGAVLALTASVAPAMPPPYVPTTYPTVKHYPTIYKPYCPPPVVIKTPPVVVFPTITRPYVPAPIFPVRREYSVYYRFSAFDPWIRFTTTYDFRRAEYIRETFLFGYGFDSVVY